MNVKRTLRSSKFTQVKVSCPSKRIQLNAKRDVQKRAFEELLATRNLQNGGKKNRGDICRILELYAKSI